MQYACSGLAQLSSHLKALNELLKGALLSINFRYYYFNFEIIIFFVLFFDVSYLKISLVKKNCNM
ncbi:hypothetical protein Hanom_Chr07g00586711 [Helianthus anomalus]